MPGPAMLYAAAQTVSGGRRAGLMASLGIHLGGYAHVIAAAAGLSVLFHAVPVLYTLVKLAGAAYLVWLGIRLIRQAGAASVALPRVEALEPLRQGVRACFGAFAEEIAGGLKLRHDPMRGCGDPAPHRGSQFVADDYQRELAFLGIASSPAFVREPEGNGCVERFIRTLKENLLWVHRFATVEDLRLALHAFKDTYNRTWIVERHGYQTPAAVRAAQLAPLPVAA